MAQQGIIGDTTLQAALKTADLISSFSTGPSPTPTTDWESLPAVQAARIRVGMDTGINPARFNLRSVVAVQWNDTCLGIPQPGRVCAPAIVPGYRIILGYSGQRYEVHTDQLGSVVYWFPL